MPNAHTARNPMTFPGVLASLLLVVVLLYLGRVFFITLISAILLAFILDPIVNRLMRFRIPRSAASFLACTFMLGVIYLLGLGLWTQVVGLWDDLPTYSRQVTKIVDSATQHGSGYGRFINDLLVPNHLR